MKARSRRERKINKELILKKKRNQEKEKIRAQYFFQGLIFEEVKKVKEVKKNDKANLQSSSEEKNQKTH